MKLINFKLIPNITCALNINHKDWYQSFKRILLQINLFYDKETLYIFLGTVKIGEDLPGTS